MLYEAATWDSEPDARPPIGEILSRPRTALYVAGWGRPGDTGFVAEAAGTPVGTAWYRFYARSACGYGFVDESVPELTIGVEAAWRRRGIGRALLEALLDGARAASVGSVSLSVEEANPALRLYERCGFRRMELVDGAWTMLADLAASAPDASGRTGPGSPSG